MLKRLVSIAVTVVMLLTFIPTAYMAGPKINSVTVKPKTVSGSGDVTVTVKTSLDVTGVVICNDTDPRTPAANVNPAGAVNPTDSAKYRTWVYTMPASTLGTTRYYATGTTADGTAVPEKSFTVTVKAAQLTVQSVATDPKKVLAGEPFTVTVKTSLKVGLVTIVTAAGATLLNDADFNAPTLSPDGKYLYFTAKKTIALPTVGKHPLIVKGLPDTAAVANASVKDKSFTITAAAPALSVLKITPSASRVSLGDKVSLTVTTTAGVDAITLLDSSGGNTGIAFTPDSTNTIWQSTTQLEPLSSGSNKYYVRITPVNLSATAKDKAFTINVTAPKVSVLKVTPSSSRVLPGGAVSLTITTTAGVETLEVYDSLNVKQNINFTPTQNTTGLTWVGNTTLAPPSPGSNKYYVRITPIDKRIAVKDKPFTLTVTAQRPKLVIASGSPSTINEGSAPVLLVRANKDTTLVMVQDANGNYFVADTTVVDTATGTVKVTATDKDGVALIPQPSPLPTATLVATTSNTWRIDLGADNLNAGSHTYMVYPGYKDSSGKAIFSATGKRASIKIKGPELFGVSSNLKNADENQTVTYRVITNRLTDRVVLLNNGKSPVSLTPPYTIADVSPFIIYDSATSDPAMLSTSVTSQYIYWDITLTPEYDFTVKDESFVNYPVTALAISMNSSVTPPALRTISAPRTTSYLEVAQHIVESVKAENANTHAGRPVYVEVTTNTTSTKVELIIEVKNDLDEYVPATAKTDYTVANRYTTQPTHLGGKKLWNYEVIFLKMGEYRIMAKSTASTSTTTKISNDAALVSIAKRTPAISSASAAPRFAAANSPIDFYVRTNLETNFVRLYNDELYPAPGYVDYDASMTNEVSVTRVDGELRWVITRGFDNADPTEPFVVNITCGYRAPNDATLSDDDSSHNPTVFSVSLNLSESPKMQQLVSATPTTVMQGQTVQFVVETNAAASRLRFMKSTANGGELFHTVAVQDVNVNSSVNKRVWTVDVPIPSTLAPGDYKIYVECGNGEGYKGNTSDIRSAEAAITVKEGPKQPDAVTLSKTTGIQQGETITATVTANAVTDCVKVLLGDWEIATVYITDLTPAPIPNASGNPVWTFPVTLPSDAATGTVTLAFITGVKGAAPAADYFPTYSDAKRTKSVTVAERPRFIKERYPFDVQPSEAKRGDTITVQLATTTTTTNIRLEIGNGTAYSTLKMESSSYSTQNNEKLWKITFLVPNDAQDGAYYIRATAYSASVPLTSSNLDTMQTTITVIP